MPWYQTTREKDVNNMNMTTHCNLEGADKKKCSTVLHTTRMIDIEGVLIVSVTHTICSQIPTISPCQPTSASCLQLEYEYILNANYYVRVSTRHFHSPIDTLCVVPQCLPN